MVEGSQRRILQIWLFSTQPNPQKTRVEHYDMDTPLAYFLLMWFGGRQQCGRLQQQGGEDQGGR